MSRDKRTEIANDLNRHCCSLAEQFCGEMSCNSCITDYLYNAGYRKEVDVASEIFEEIEQKLRGLFDFFRQDDYIRESSAIMLAISEIAELKKKYTEGEG